MNQLQENLNSFLINNSQQIIKSLWEETKYYDKIKIPTVCEFLKNTFMKKELPIVAPEGYEIDKERMVFVPKEIDLFPDADQIPLAYSSNTFEGERLIGFHANLILRDKILAFTKLIQLRDEVNLRDGFVVDWSDYDRTKYCLGFYCEKLEIEYRTKTQKTFAFRTPKIAEQFAEKYNHLIEQCKDLI